MKEKWLIFSRYSVPSIILLVVLFLVFFKLIPAAKAGINFTAHVVSVCGNNLIEEGEECDGSDLNSKTCVALGYMGGTLSCYSNCTFDKTNCTSGGGGGGGGGGGAGSVTETKVILRGKAYPNALITALVDGKVVTTQTSEANASFQFDILNLSGGTYTFGLWAEDNKGRKSLTFSFTTNIPPLMITTISGIFIPPTIELDKVNVSPGEIINILGQTAPESEITVSVESPQEIIKTTNADKLGDWEYPFSTASLEEGIHTTRAKAKSTDDLISPYSKLLTFYVGKYAPSELCPGADFNKDGKVNLIDFSILLYWWGKANACVDLNHDGVVNLPDFSILMYWWTG